VTWRELPPTAGLPTHWSDFAPWSAAQSLEAGLASLLGVPEVRIECSGTASLVIALSCLKKSSPRRTVVLPAYTCPLVPLAVARAGLRIALCDTVIDGFDLDPGALGAACDDDTLCVVPTHLGGAVADLDPALEAARRSGATVIEDAAQSLGASWRGRPVGTIGEIGFYSLACGKGLTLFEGGVLVARDEALRRELAETSRAIIHRSLAIEAWRLLQLAGYAASYRPMLLRWVYGLPLRFWLARGELERAVGDDSEDIPLHRVSWLRKRVGAAGLPRLGPWLRSSAERGAQRARKIEEIDGLVVVGGSREGVRTWPFLMVLFRSAAACERALAKLWGAGLGVTRLFVRDLAGYGFLDRIVPRVAVPNARSFAMRCLTISNSPWVSEEDFERIVGVLRDAVHDGGRVRSAP
jgi:dTDP-4-amino-4,6-dideoxygalactose transaminase